MRTTLPAGALAGLLAAALAAAPAGAQDRTLTVDPRACRMVADHVPSQGAEYRPGADARGNAVAPADLPGSWGATNPAAPELPVTFRIGVDLAQRFGLPAGAADARFGVPRGQGLSIQDMTAAQVTVQGSTVLLDGRPIGSGQRGDLADLCRRAGLLR
jgi:hypothetical protein